jgi:hypothetical protein
VSRSLKVTFPLHLMLCVISNKVAVSSDIFKSISQTKKKSVEIGDILSLFRN